MANVLVNETSLSDIADAIRGKNGSQTRYKPYEMADAIDELVTGGIIPTGAIQVTQNGTYDVTNYASAEVNVSGGSSLGTKSITANGTYQASDDSLDGYSSVTVNVAGTNNVVEINSLTNTSDAWTFPPVANTLSNGGVFELTFTDPSPTNDYGNIISFGGQSALSQYNTNQAVHFYHGYVAGDHDYIVVRMNNTGYGYRDIDRSQPHTLKIDKDYIYIDDVPVVAPHANIVSLSNVSFGSSQGSKRFSGIIDKITYR